MVLTLINSQNVYFFDGLIGERYEARDKDELYLGVIDNNVAVCAAAFTFFERRARLKYIATDPQKRRKGYAAFLLKSAMDYMKTSMVDTFDAVIFLPSNEWRMDADIATADYPKAEGPEEALLGLIESVGLKCQRLNLIRTVYSLEQIEGCLGTGLVSGNVKKLEELTAEEKQTIYEAEEDNAGSVAYINPAVYVSKRNKYGRFYVEEGSIKTMVSCRQFADGVLIDSIYAGPGGMAHIDELYLAILKAVKADYKKDTKVYIDTFGTKLIQYQQKRIPVKPKELLVTYVFSCDI